MKYELSAPSWFDRVLCGLVHVHERWKDGGHKFRRCLTFGCGMLVIKELPLARMRRKARKDADVILMGGRRGG